MTRSELPELSVLMDRATRGVAVPTSDIVAGALARGGRLRRRRRVFIGAGALAAVAVLGAGAVWAGGSGPGADTADDPKPAPAGQRTLALVPTTTCAPYTYRGQNLACHNYDIRATGFAAGSTQRVTLHACFGTGSCHDHAKIVRIGAQGTGVLKGGVGRAYAGYVITATIGDTTATVTVP